MPNRILREGILTSARVDQLTPLAEIFYRRVMSVADDYGRYFAHPALLRAACYPLKLDAVSEKQILGWLREVESAGLLIIYGYGLAKYLELRDFRQRQRFDSKYPYQETVLKTDVKTAVNANRHPDTPTPTPVLSLSLSTTGVVKGETGGWEEFWDAYPKKVGKQDTLRAWRRLKPDIGLVKTLLVAVSFHRGTRQWQEDGGKYIPHPATWLNMRRWEDQLGDKSTTTHKGLQALVRVDAEIQSKGTVDAGLGTIS